MKIYIRTGNFPIGASKKKIDDISTVYALTANEIAHQFSPQLLAFLLHHRDGLSFIDIVGKSFCNLSKEWQAEYIRISTIYELVKQEEFVGEINRRQAEVDRSTKPEAPAVAVDGKWVVK